MRQALVLGFSPREGSSVRGKELNRKLHCQWGVRPGLGGGWSDGDPVCRGCWAKRSWCRGAGMGKLPEVGEVRAWVKGDGIEQHQDQAGLGTLTVRYGEHSGPPSEIA